MLSNVIECYQMLSNVNECYPMLMNVMKVTNILTNFHTDWTFLLNSILFKSFIG